jgi:hypothetical protein
MIYDYSAPHLDDVGYYTEDEYLPIRKEIR